MGQTLTYQPKVVCEALGLPAPTLATWTARGLLDALKSPRAPQGAARMFTLADVLALAVIKEASVRGTVPTELPAAAIEAAEEWIDTRGRITKLHLRYYTDRTAISYDDHLMHPPPPQDWRTEFTFNIGEIFAATERALAPLANRPRRAARWTADGAE